MTNAMFLSKMQLLMAPNPKTLTVPLDFDTLTDFAVAVKIFRGRSISSHVHNFVIQQINEAKKMVPPEEFDRLTKEQKEATLNRSKSRAAAAKNSTLKIQPDRVLHAQDLGELSGGRSAKKKKTG